MPKTPRKQVTPEFYKEIKALIDAGVPVQSIAKLIPGASLSTTNRIKLSVDFADYRTQQKERSARYKLEMLQKQAEASHVEAVETVENQKMIEYTVTTPEAKLDTEMLVRIENKLDTLIAMWQPTEPVAKKGLFRR